MPSPSPSPSPSPPPFAEAVSKFGRFENSAAAAADVFVALRMSRL